MKKVNLILLVLFLLTTAGCSVSASDESESGAINTVDSYLKHMKTGEITEASKYLDTDTSLIDVFAYKYLDTIQDNDFHDNILYLSKNGLSDKEWEDKLTSIHEKYGDEEKYFIQEGEEPEFDIGPFVFVEDLTKEYKNYRLLYDLEIADEIGNKLYKKIEFSVTWDLEKEKFLISSITIR